MGPDVCSECGGDVVWDGDAGSAVCVACGNLQDPSQVVLNTHLDTVDKTDDNYGLAFPTGPSSVGFRNQTRWHLAGESKTATAESNKNAMRRYIAALTRRIGHSALATRTTFLFNRAMEEGQFRYGRKARLVAGACLAIALREEQKGETIKDIAYLLDDSPVALARVFTTVIALLNIKLTSVDPGWHLPLLQRHLLEILAEDKPSIPSNLAHALKSVHLPSALRTAYSLAELVSRSAILTDLPSPPTACAIYILALEGELLSSLPHCGELADALGRRFGVRKGVVMRRYKTIYDRVEGWAVDVPWIAQSAESAPTKSSSSKVAKRVAVARRLKDAVQFQEGLWKSKLGSLEPVGLPDVEGEIVSSSGFNRGNEVDLQGTTEVSSSSSSPPPKRRKRHHIEDASQFLVSPTHLDIAGRRGQLGVIPSLDVVSHMLATDSSFFHRAPTRLQLLLSEKSADEIAEEELFAEGELESYMRSQSEQEALIRLFDWAQETDATSDVNSEDGHTPQARNRERARGSTSRINIEALDRLLNATETVGGAEATYNDDDDDWAMARIAEGFALAGVDHFDHSRDRLGGAPLIGSKGNKASPTAENDEVVTPWRPISPGGRSSWADLSRYEDE